ncbi:MAG: tetratricopeptide repeat protein [Bacteroidetes bacterium]|nr:tetratricopeptide repeat protein [Bacteroidota bacterium]
MKFIFFPLIAAFFLLTACNPEPTAEVKNSAKTDSLLAKINSPELLALNKKILADPNNATLYHERAKVYLDLKQLDEALGDARRALNLDSTNADNFMMVADVYFAHNNTKQSKDMLEHIIVKFPKNTDALLKLAELHFFVKQYEKAFEKINAALKINENIAKAYYLKGSIYKETGDTAKAVSSMETAVEQDNRYFNAFMDLGLMYAARHNPLALEYYDNAININPLSSEALYAKAKYLQDVANYDGAMQVYERLLSHDPAHAHTLYNMGAITFHVKKDPKKAIDYFTKAINADAQYAEAYYARGACYDELNDHNNAVADYNMCLQIKPNYGPAAEALSASK